MQEQEKAIKVLLVEDNPFDAKVVADLLAGLKAGGFELRIAETLESAREEDAREKADIVLLDLNLPDSLGATTLLRAEEIFEDRPIIVMTGLHERQLGIELIKKGAQDYLVKGKITADWLDYSIKYSIERAKLELRMKQREARLRDILEEIPDGFLVVRPDGRALFANRGAERILGRTRGELLSRPFTVESDTERPLETELRRPDGRKVPAEVRAVEIHWGPETCRLVMLRDLTLARTLERNRDDFISMVSHELRSPLTIVKESLGLVSDGTAGAVGDKQKEILKMGLDNVGRLERLIDALLDITKIEAGVMPLEMAVVDLGELITSTASDYSYLAAERGIEMRTELPAQPLETCCDKEKVRQVLVNLLSNALKFTPAGGYISLSSRPWESEALLCVENSGPGIDAEDLPRLFNKFTRLNRSAAPAAKGTGLGLAISRGIVEMHRGRIWAESEPGKGCKFYLMLPVLGYSESLKALVRREIDLAGEKRQFCAVTLLLPPGLPAAAGQEKPAAKLEAIIKTRMRSYHAILKRGEEEITVLLSNSGIKECAKAAATAEKGLQEISGLPGEKTAGLVSGLLYPDDFQDEGTYMLKAAAAREKLHV